MKKLENAITWLINDRSDTAMICRTVIEAVFAYVTANLGTILNLFHLSADTKMLLMGIFTAVYSAVLSAIRKGKAQD